MRSRDVKPGEPWVIVIHGEAGNADFQFIGVMCPTHVARAVQAALRTVAKPGTQHYNEEMRSVPDLRS